MQLLILDNHDSFSAILWHDLWELCGVKPWFYPNDGLTLDQLKSLPFDAAVLSPGPGHPAHPRDFGICHDLLQNFPALPILGVCLGHQGLAHFGGARVIPWPQARHGRTSAIRHTGSGLFQGLPQGFAAVRYHSLVVDPDSVPRNMEVTAWSEDDCVMGLQYRDRPWMGVQFHPESIGSEQGKALLRNFIQSVASPRIPWESIPPKAPKKSGPVSFNFSVPHREIPWQDPEAVFHSHFRNAPYAFWLDGSASTSKTGWPCTVMGCAEGETPEPKLAAHSRHARHAPWPGYCGGPVGYFAYENSGRWLEPRGYLVFHHATHKAYAAWEEDAPPAWLQSILNAWSEVSPVAAREASRLPGFSHWQAALPKTEYLHRVLSLQQSIAHGDTYEACLTHAFSVRAEANPWEIFCRLRRHNPAPYAAYLAFPDAHVLSASPELFLELSADGILRSRPIKGTRPRGVDLAEDAALRQDLSTHPKDRAENLMIVDLTRHDFCKVCALGSVEVTSFLEVETHPRVLQLVSEVRGRLEAEQKPLDAVRACFPGGSMTGAPKERTLELLRAAEVEPRGVFSGALGYFSRDGSFCLSMVIRTLENRGSAWRVGCGGAILIDSDPEAEWNEALLKARSVIDAVS